jgi:hypothetical protein
VVRENVTKRAVACPFSGALSRKMLKRRVKTVSFRLSPEEYQAYQQVCVAAGFCSLSEFARKALQFFVDHRSSAARDLEVEGLRARVESLSSEVARLAEAVGLPEYR